MNILELINKMKTKGYYYVTGNTNDRDDIIYLNFTTNYNGRGEFANFEIFNNNHSFRSKYVFKENLSDVELFKLIDELC